jgi:8-oxo-dGTP diphosphatase
MPPKMPLFVVAAALIDAEGRVLVQKRPAGKSMARLWEFPGGKVEQGEGPENALVRELREELGITVATDALRPIGFASEPLDGQHLILLLYLCRSWTGEPIAHHADELAWHSPASLRSVAMPPADGPLIDLLEQALQTAPNPSKR